MSAKHRMEEHLADLRKVQKAKLARADNRAMELNDLRPSQGNQMLEPSVDTGLSGGAAGLARVVGGGKKRMAKGGFLPLLATAIPLISSLFGRGMMTEDAHKKLMALMKKRKVGEHSKLSGGFWGALASLAVPLISSLFGKGKMTKEAHDELSKCFKGDSMKGGSFADAQFGMVNEPVPPTPAEAQGVEGGAKYGKMLREHFMKMKGSGFVNDFAQGFMGSVKPDIHSHLRGNMGPHQSNAAKMKEMETLKSVGAGRKCKGGKEQMDAEMMMGDGMMLGKDGKGQRKMGAGRAGAGATGAGDARKARGQAVSRLMKEKGMSLGEASRYVKEHGF
jgi:hypothetical protein